MLKRFWKPRKTEITKPETEISLPQPDAINRGGGLAFEDTPLMTLYRQSATSLWSGDGYYERKTQWLQRFQENVGAAMQADPRFPFALAAYARDKRGLALRSSPIGLYAEAAIHPAAKGSGLIRQYGPKILRRADEPAEVIAYFRRHHEGAIPHGLLRGVGDALRQFDEYQLGKYKNTHPVSLRDAFRLARPKPHSEAERLLWNRAVAGALATPYTWETELSLCATEDEKRQKWNELLASGKLGLFALVRNIRNIAKTGADIEQALEQITAERVHNSGILPFQWYKAYKAVWEKAGPVIAEPLQQAVQWSLDDIAKLPGITLVACDNSGSMSGSYPTRGMSYAETANLMGAMVLYCCQQGIAGTFGETFALAKTDPGLELFENKALIDRCGATTGHATNAWKIFQALIAERIYVDRVIIFSDMQCYDSGARHAPLAYAGHSLSAELQSYQRINPVARVYSVNLATADNTCQFAPHQPVVELAGWSESIFQFIASTEVGQDIVPWILENY